MIRQSPNHVMTGPSRFGIIPVDVFFGEVRRRPDRQCVFFGEFVLDAQGDLCIFIGTRADGMPLLKNADASNEYILRVLRDQLDHERFFHRSDE